MRAQSGNQRMCLPRKRIQSVAIVVRKEIIASQHQQRNNQSSPMPFWFHQINSVFKFINVDAGND